MNQLTKGILKSEEPFYELLTVVGSGVYCSVGIKVISGSMVQRTGADTESSNRVFNLWDCV